MAQSHAAQQQIEVQSLLPDSGYRRPSRRGIHLRRKKLSVARLGGRRPLRVVALLRLIRKMRTKWVRLRCACMLKKLSQYYRDFVKDIAEAGTAFDAFQRRLLMEISFAIPILGASLSNYPLP